MDAQQQKPLALVAENDVEALVVVNEGKIASIVEQWPIKYYERFQRWYVRRMNKFTGKTNTFDAYLVLFSTDCLHHVKNWHNGLQKALIKDKNIDKTRLRLRAIMNADAPGFNKIAVLDPKTHQLMYVTKDTLIEVMTEQSDVDTSGQTATNLETSASVSESANITFVDERPVDNSMLHTKGDVSTRDLHKDIAENDWTINSVLQREYPIRSFEWKVSDKQTDKIVEEGLPKMITDDQNCMITRQLMFFAFMRAGVKVRVQLNGTKFHCGRLIVYFKPITWDDDKEENFYSLTCFPHFFLDASVSNSGEIDIPFTHLLSHFSQESKTLFNDSINTLGTLNIRPYNVLQAAEKSSQSLFGQVYISLANPAVHLPTYQIAKFSYGNGYMQGLEALLKKQAGSLIGSGLGLADKFTGGLVTGAGDALCNLLGICDKPSDPVSAQPMINRTVAPLCHGAGLDRSIRLGLSPTSQTDTVPDIVGALDTDFNILTLCQMPCLLEQPEWNVTQQPGVKLFDMLVTPTYVNQFTNNGDSRVANYYPTMMAYVSRAFCLWRGTLKLKIQIIATQFHSGRLALVYDPHGTRDVNIEEFDKNKSHNIVIMDVQEQQELTIELPYFAVKPWLRCDRFRSSVNLKDASKVENPSYLDCDSMGVFRIYVLNSLVRPENVTDKVQLNVMFYAGDNFELAVPNPVAPLSVRKGPSGTSYPNIARYSWCKEGTSELCALGEQILYAYFSGLDQIRSGAMKPGDQWWNASIVYRTTDTIECQFLLAKIQILYASSTGVCETLIKSLPNYSVADGSVIQRIDTNTQDSQNELVTLKGEISRNFNDVLNQVGKIESKTNDIYSNSLMTIQNLNDVKLTTTQINNSTDYIKRNLATIDNHVISNGSDVRQCIQINKCYEEKAVGSAARDITWKLKKNEPCEKTGIEQGLENYTTTRENDGMSVTVTSGNNKASVAPQTVSENAMNLQTLLRRYFPLYISGDIKASLNFTLLTIPVSPSFVPNDEETNLTSPISRRYEVHNLAWFSRLFTYNRGSLRYKILVNSPNSDIYVWHNPIDVKNFKVSHGFDYDHVVEQMNFASDVAVSQVQQGLEVEIPFYSSFNQLVHSHVSSKQDLRAQNGTLYVAVRNTGIPMNVSVFMSTGDDFNMNVLRAPPVVHEKWLEPYTDDIGSSIVYPEFQRSMGHDSSNVQTPGTSVINRYSKGVYKQGRIPPLDFSVMELQGKMQQMEEQMFSSIKNMTGVSAVEEVYKQDVQPTLLEARDLIKDSKTFLDEFKQYTLPSILGNAKCVHRDIQETQQMVKDFLPKIDLAMEHLNVFMVQAGVTATQIGDAAESLGEATTYMSWFMKTLLISSIWMNLINLVKKFSWTALINVVCLLCSLFQIQASNVIQWLYANAMDLYNEYRTKATNGAMCEQGFEEFLEENSQSLSLALAGVATVLYCALFGVLPKWSLVRDSIRATIETQLQEQGLADGLKSAHFTNMGFKAIANSFDFFKEWIDRLIRWYLGQDCREVVLEKQFAEKSRLIEEWMTEIESLEDEDLYQLALSDIDLHNKFFRLVDQGNEFSKWLLTAGVSKNVSSIIRDVNRRLHDMIKRIKKISPGHGFRYAPFVVMLDGKSGVAKSNMMHKFTDMIKEVLNIPHYNSVCVVPKTKEFLDGYEGQAIIEWDDMLQCPKQDEMVAEFINWRSNADCIINKAHVDEKGAHFTSKAIVMSTNHGNINVNSIRDMDAFRNRINLKFVCKLRDGITSDDLKTMPRDSTFGFVSLNAYKVEESGRRFALFREDMTLMEALDLARNDLIAWNVKQNEMIDEYLQNHGSMRIPHGVHVVHEQGLVIKIEDDLSEEQLIDAELFQMEFEDAEPIEQEKYLEIYKNSKEFVLNNSKKFWGLIRKKFTLCVDKITSVIKEFYIKHPNITKTLGIVAAFGMAGMLCKTLYSMFAENSEEESAYDPVSKPARRIIKAEQYDVVPKTSTKTVKAEQYDVVTKNPTKVVKAECCEEGTDDVEAVTVARNKIHPLLAVLGWENSERAVRLQGLAIGGKIILCPHHFFRSAKKGDMFYYLRGNDKILVEYVPDRLERIGDKDAVLYYVGAQFDSRKDIMNCFVSEADLSKLGKSLSVLLMGCSMTGVMMEKAGRAVGNVRMEYKGKDDGAPLYVQNGWKYEFNTVDGECGSILIGCSKVLPPPAKIIGMHVAGYANQRGGFSILLTREMIQNALVNIIARHGKQVYGASLPEQVNPDEQAYNDRVAIEPQGSFSYYGVMDSKFCPSQPRKTCLRKTPYFEEIYPSVKKPAMLVKTGEISPLAKALTKYGKLTKPFPAQLIKIVRNDILNELMNIRGDMKIEPTSEQVAIFGIEGMPYCERMNFKSSAGWPYQCLPEGKGQFGKAYLFDIENQCVADRELRRRLDERESEAKFGKRVPSVWRDCLKDELRPNEKVDQGKTRLFTIAPVDYTILVRKYFLAFEQAFYKNHSKFFSAVGINPESFEWTAAYNRLREVGFKCIAGDFTGYDGTLMADLMKEAGDIIDDWYKLNGETDEDATLIRRVLIDEMIHTYQLVLNCVYKTHQGNPSGNPLTVILNTIVNAFYMRLAWMIIMLEKCPKLANMAAFHEFTRDEAYGDDNRITVADCVVEWYNQVSVTECLAEHGIVYTDELKTGVIIPYKDLHETSFLKRAYRVDTEVGKEFMLPAMDVDTITSLTNWYRDADDIEVQLVANQRAALDFAFFHGRDFYDLFDKNLTQKMRDHEIVPLSITYDEQLLRFTSMMHGDANGKFDNFCDLGF